MPMNFNRCRFFSLVNEFVLKPGLKLCNSLKVFLKKKCFNYGSLIDNFLDYELLIFFKIYNNNKKKKTLVKLS